MSVAQRQNVDYGLSQPLNSVFPPPIVAKRAPTTADMAQLGTIWVQPTNTSGTAVNGAWILTSIINNSANWADASGAGGTFASLTVTPGPISLTGTTTINTSGAANTNIGTS